MRKNTFIAILFLLLPLTALAQFTDATLRLDYIFSGNAKEQSIALHRLSTSPRWYGKKRHMSEVPVEGNGQIIATSLKGDTIYRNSFSTLFQEWLYYPEAEVETRSFENVFLMPMPAERINVTVELYDNRHKTIAKLTHAVDPKDILIRHIGEKDLQPYTTVLAPADTSRCIRVAFVAEGYREDEMETFQKDVAIATEAIFKHEPFRSLKDRFHVVAVASPSKDSGASEPKQGVWLNTVLGSSFDTFYSDRYLTTLNLFALHDVLAGIPYEHIIVLVNTDKYGGGGILNSYNLTMTHHPKFRPVVVHEFGHSFAGLADEYAYPFEEIPAYPIDVEPWEPNITTLVGFKSKWEDMVTKNARASKKDSTIVVDKGSIGLYRGAGYNTGSIYRATEDCRMRTNETPEFCPVCQRSIRQLIEFYTGE